MFSCENEMIVEEPHAILDTRIVKRNNYEGLKTFCYEIKAEEKSFAFIDFRKTMALSNSNEPISIN